VYAVNATAARLVEYKAQAEILKALAHPTRLLIIDELSEGERCVCELTELVGHEMPTISRHLSLLKFAGIVVDEKRGSQVFYKLKRRCVMDFFHCIASVQASKDCDSPSACGPRPRNSNGALRQQRNGKARL
jgi:DNA-binding transcriptional ArsR family regulator